MELDSCDPYSEAADVKQDALFDPSTQSPAATGPQTNGFNDSTSHRSHQGSFEDSIPDKLPNKQRIKRPAPPPPRSIASSSRIAEPQPIGCSSPVISSTGMPTCPPSTRRPLLKVQSADSLTVSENILRSKNAGNSLDSQEGRNSIYEDVGKTSKAKTLGLRFNINDLKVKLKKQLTSKSKSDVNCSDEDDIDEKVEEKFTHKVTVNEVGHRVGESISRLIGRLSTTGHQLLMSSDSLQTSNDAKSDTVNIDAVLDDDHYSTVTTGTDDSSQIATDVFVPPTMAFDHQEEDDDGGWSDSEFDQENVYSNDNVEDVYQNSGEDKKPNVTNDDHQVQVPLSETEESNHAQTSALVTSISVDSRSETTDPDQTTPDNEERMDYMIDYRLDGVNNGLTSEEDKLRKLEALKLELSKLCPIKQEIDLKDASNRQFGKVHSNETSPSAPSSPVLSRWKEKLHNGFKITNKPQASMTPLPTPDTASSQQFEANVSTPTTIRRSWLPFAFSNQHKSMDSSDGSSSTTVKVTPSAPPLPPQSKEQPLVSTYPRQPSFPTVTRRALPPLPLENSSSRTPSIDETTSPSPSSNNQLSLAERQPPPLPKSNRMPLKTVNERSPVVVTQNLQSGALGKGADQRNSFRPMEFDVRSWNKSQDSLQRIASLSSETDSDLHQYAWYFGSVSREKSEYLLRSMSMDGSFIVRDSKNGGPNCPYAISIFYAGVIYHLLIRQKANGKYAVGIEKPDEQEFSNVYDLIASHRHSPVYLISNVDDSCGLVTLTQCPPKLW